MEKETDTFLPTDPAQRREVLGSQTDEVLSRWLDLLNAVVTDNSVAASLVDDGGSSIFEVVEEAQRAIDSISAHMEVLVYH